MVPAKHNAILSEKRILRREYVYQAVRLDTRNKKTARFLRFEGAGRLCSI